MIEMPTVFADGTVLPPGCSHECFAPPGGLEPRAGDARHDPRREQALHVPLARLGDMALLDPAAACAIPKPYDRSAEFLSKLAKADGADDIAHAMYGRGCARRLRLPLRLGRGAPTLLGTDLSRMLGAAHGMEIPFVFGHFELGERPDRIFTPGNEPGRLALSGAMMDYWTQFARDGRPDAGGEGCDAELARLG
jgi:para-nitrobenzyl esterase